MSIINASVSIKYHGNLFLGVQLAYSSISSDNGLVPTRRQAIIWTNGGLFTDAYMRQHIWFRDISGQVKLTTWPHSYRYIVSLVRPDHWKTGRAVTRASCCQVASMLTIVLRYPYNAYNIVNKQHLLFPFLGRNSGRKFFLLLCCPWHLLPHIFLWYGKHKCHYFRT